MRFKFFNAEETSRNAKATVHSSGKLGFSGDAIDYLDIKEGKAILLGQNEEDEKDINLYAAVYDSMQEGAFRFNKAGDYFYLNTKNLFDSLDIDYKNKKIIYDLVKFDYDGQPMIKMLRREITKKSKSE